MILFTDKLQRANPDYPIVDSSDVKGGFFTVDVVEELSEIPQLKLQDGMLAYVKNKKKYYSYVETDKSWKEAKLGSQGLQVFTPALYESLEDKPEEYISISNFDDLNGQIKNNTYTVSQNGTYVDVLFQAIRALQSEVAKLKNTFYYGIQSYNGTDTASANIILDNKEQEEKEPLWALDPEDLSEFDDYSIIIGPESSLTPINNLAFKDNYIDIQDLVSADIDLNFEISGESKQCVYIIADVNAGAVISLGLSGDSDLNFSLQQYLPRDKCNILVIINRKTYNEDTEEYNGKNYIWVQITDVSGQVVKTGYFDGSNLVAEETVLESRYYINNISFNKINLYKCNFYSKQSGFTNDDVLSSLTPDENFAFKAAHIAIRSVANKDTLLAVKSRLMENELVLVEEEGQLYIKNKNQLISLSSKTTTDNETMTSEQILNILIEAGYITKDEELNSATLSAIDELTFIHTESGKQFNIKVNSDGKLIIDQNQEITPDTWNSSTDGKINYTKRGAVGHYTLGSNYEKSTKEAPIAIYGNSNDPKAYGDRVRFGSWYTPKLGQTTYGCSHDFIELANSGSKDYPLEGARLFIIKGKIISETTSNAEDKPIISYYLSEASVHKFILSGVIKAGGTYLIRGVKHNSKSPVVNLDSYDYELRQNQQLFSLEGTIGMVLLNASQSNDIEFIESDTFKVENTPIYYLSEKIFDNTDVGTFNTRVRSDLIDCVGFDNPQAFRVKSNSKSGVANAFGAKAYSIYADYIVKDFFELDPSRQGFLSLTTKDFESTGYRINKINAEYLNLANKNISFPHSDEQAEIARFTPKASYENKTICTDKTPLNITKPNMVSCFFGIDMQTTRCFNWVSNKDQNEYVWIRKQGDTKWNRFESYKGDSSEISTDNDSYETGKINRVKYTSTVINQVYKRLKGVFPGSNYSYVGHKCVVYIQDAPTTDPITYEYLVGTTLNNGLPDMDKCSNLQTFTLYPSSWKPMVYHISDQQGFEWTEYQVWAAAAKQMLKQINEECNSESRKFPVLINTGDCTQNGTRYNEWLDYYNAGYCLFDHLEQLNVVGNNDLANAYDHSVLGTGNDEGKSNPYYFHLINCYELDSTENYSHEDSQTEYIKNWQHPLIYNNVYFPSTYYTYFNNFGYLLINSELTIDSCKGLFKATYEQGVDTFTYNLYTGYLENQSVEDYNNTSNENKTYSFKQTIAAMLEKLKEKQVIVACHEMPFTVITVANLSGNTYRLDRSCNGNITDSITHTALVGSHMNRLHYGSSWDNDDNQWFSQLLQEYSIKLCIGGHKHSYACTYPIYENPALIQQLLANIDVYKDYHPSKIFITLVDDDKITASDTDLGVDLGDKNLYAHPSGTAYSLLRVSNKAILDGEELADKAVTYFMVQATGYKLKSNKELPSVNQSFSVIRPKTNADNTAHYSQESPMFATIDFVDSYWGISLYRIINIKTTAATKITEFSSIKYSSKPMVTEKLILSYDDSTGANDNYWYTTNPVSDYQFDYTNEDSDRCWGLADNKVSIYQNDQINYTQYTLTVKL